MSTDPHRWAVARVGGAPGQPWEVMGPTIFQSFTAALAYAREFDHAMVYQLELVQTVHRG